MPITETSILLPGPAGMLEAHLHIPPQESDWAGIVCHPHSLHGGTMNNKVVTTVARTFRDLHMVNLRFNFRGVGKSEGSYDAGNGETEDTLAMIHYIKQRWPEKKICLAGFSFGAYVSLRAATKIPVQQLITIAPAVNHADFSGLHPQTDWIVVIAEKDEIVPAQEIYAWIKTLNPPPKILSFPETSHFFDGQLITLREQLIEKLSYAHPL